MDSNGLAVSDYKNGWRAYHHEGRYFFKLPGGSNHSATDRESIKEWHTLRAYQDEQRKKGEPIILSYKQKPEWCGRDYKEFVFLLKSDNSPVIAVGSPTEGYDWSRGEFTNFRWRPGHGHTEPKLSEEESMRRQWGGAWMAKNTDGTYVLEWQKGGSNG